MTLADMPGALPSAITAAARWWAPARDEEINAALHALWDDDITRKQYERARAFLMRPDWVPVRGGRKMPALWGIASHWAERGGPFEIDLEHPHCFACGIHGNYPQDIPKAQTRWHRAKLERSHIIARARDGLDGAQNIVPLCKPCNRTMPLFEAGEDEAAFRWLADGGAMGELDKRAAAAGFDWIDRTEVWHFAMLHRGGLARDGDLMAAEAHSRFIERISPIPLAA